jgi:hypothetical protein
MSVTGAVNLSVNQDHHEEKHKIREVGLEVNTEKTKNMVVSHHQVAGQNHNLLIVHKYFENMTEFKYWE